MTSMSPGSVAHVPCKSFSPVYKLVNVEREVLWCLLDLSGRSEAFAPDLSSGLSGLLLPVQKNLSHLRERLQWIIGITVFSCFRVPEDSVRVNLRFTP